MSVRVLLDQQNAAYYTNQDFVTGRVILSLATDTTITAINVKLEGESRTRLSGPKFQNDPKNRQKIELEVHRLLYKVQTVFPNANLVQDSVNSSFTLSAGQHTYPFSLKIPFNNDCANNQNILQDLRLGPLLLQDLTGGRHVKQTLPPTLSGLPGEAEIKYFVKATVVRPKFYQENIRSVINIRFQPVEPPRAAPCQQETYARRQHQFQIPSATSTPKSSKSGLFGKRASTISVGEPPAIKVEARLPSPAILLCHSPLPLRIQVEKTNDAPASIFLSLLQIELIGYTKVRAHDLSRTETASWVIMSQANMKLPLDSSASKMERSFLVPTRYWSNLPLPKTVVPSFTTCNLSRSYELEIRIGISHGDVNNMHPELVVLPLRFPVQVFSGIQPSEQYLHPISTQQQQQQPSSSFNLNAPPTPFDMHYDQPSPILPTHDSHPAPTGSYVAPPLPHDDDPNDLPPSYEDAIAEEIHPADGPRRHHTPPDIAPPTSMHRRDTSDPDSKSNLKGINRHPSERLFSQNAPTPPGLAAAARLRHQRQQQQTVSMDSLADDLDEMNVRDSSGSPTDRQAPPLPSRQGTKDSLRSRKGTY